MSGIKNIYGYRYEKPERQDGYIAPSLSEQDEYVPSTHIGMYSILRNPKSKSVYMGEIQCQSIRKKTYNSVLEIFRQYNSPDYADLWNYNISVINDCGLNYFITNPKIAPVGDLIECFETEDKIKTGHTRLIISFGINKKLLAEYFKNPSKIPKLKPPGNKSREAVIFGEDTIKIGKEGKFVIERNAIYNRFCHWCKLQGVDKREGALMALQTLFRCYPVNGLNETEYYGMVTELDRQIFTRTHEKGEEEVQITFSKQILGQAQDIIARYNLDPNILTKPRMDFNTYANNALHLLNSNMPMKYQNPDFVKEKEDTERMERDV